MHWGGGPMKRMSRIKKEYFDKSTFHPKLDYKY